MPTSISTTRPNEKIAALAMEKMDAAISFEIARASPFTRYLFATGCVDEYSSDTVSTPVALELSPNVSNVPLYGTYPTVPQNTPKKAFHTHLGKKVGRVVLDRTELNQCGPNGVQKLIDAQKGVMVETMAQALELELLGAKTSSSHSSYDPNAFNGLLSFLEPLAEASQVLTVGGIAKSSYSRWRNRFGAMTTFAVDGRDTWTSVYQQCVRSGTVPDLMLTDEQVWRLYEATLSGNQALSPRSEGGVGFSSLVFREAAVVASSDFADVLDPNNSNTAINGYTFFLTLRGEKVSEFGLKPEMFNKKGQPAAFQNRGKGMELNITKSDLFRLEGPKEMPNSDVLQWDVIVSGQLVPKSLNRHGITKFTGAIG